MITRADFAFRIDRWDQLGDNILDHVAGIEDFQVAQATQSTASLWVLLFRVASVWAENSGSLA